MTVSELHDILGKLIEQGHSEIDVTAHCDYFDKISGKRIKSYFLHLDESDIDYQSGNIELGFRNYSRVDED